MDTDQPVDIDAAREEIKAHLRNGGGGFMQSFALAYIDRLPDEDLIGMIADGKRVLSAWVANDQDTVDEILDRRVPAQLRPVIIGILTNYAHSQ